MFDNATTIDVMNLVLVFISIIIGFFALYIPNIRFNKRIVIRKVRLKQNNNEVCTAFEIKNDSNKSINITNLFVNNKEIDMNYVDYKNGKDMQEIEGYKIAMFNTYDSLIISPGNSIFIQFNPIKINHQYDNGTEQKQQTEFAKLRIQVNLEYVNFKKTKSLEIKNDLSPLM